VLVSGDSLENLQFRVSAVMDGSELQGSVCRISPNGLAVSATHVWSENGQFLAELTAFGGHKMTLVASFPYHDIVLLQGELSHHFEAHKGCAFV
jgi:hypothetical protein